MQVAILAGGLATRLRPMTDSMPKSMIEIEGKPFIEYQLEMLRSQRVTDVVLCIGYLGDQIEHHVGDGCKFGVKVKYSYEGKQLLGTAGALKNAEQLLNDQFFIMYGDSYLFVDFSAVLSYFKRFNKLGLMVVYKNDNQLDKSNVVVENNLVKVYDKKRKADGMQYIDYGAMLLRKRLLDLIPYGQPCALEDVLVPAVEQGELLAYEVQERFYEIGSLNGINGFKEYVKEIRTKP
jgi:N-acetyl-alpha-D-muramate 1-phosphate uridylyltransferase